jgi:hypothetical protein
MTRNLIIYCIYDREHNLKHFLHCWAQCKQFDKLVVIHSDHGKAYEVPEGVIYLRRPNIGYDIGKFQDVVLNRMPGLPEWDNLLWLNDDCMPMIQDFATPFFAALKQPGVGVACMQISPYVRTHVRTTGFAISRQVAQRLIWPADPILSKDHCYLFEHVNKPQERAGHKTNQHLLAQIEAMGLKAVQVAPDASSPLFDFGYHRRLRQREVAHYRTFGKTPVQLSTHSRQSVINDIAPDMVGLVSIICPIYDKYPQIISALLCQTYHNWELHLIHDGPNVLDLPDDPRIKYIKRERLNNDYGHTIRKEWLQKVTGQYVLITNPDNYYAPPFLELALHTFNKNPKSIAVFCNQMVHSYKAWDMIPVRVCRGYIDCGGVVLRTAEAKKVGWNSLEHSADWFFFNDIANTYGPDRFTPFRGALFVHN